MSDLTSGHLSGFGDCPKVLRVLASGYQCDLFGRKEISLKIDAYLNVAGLIPDTSKYSVKVIL